MWREAHRPGVCQCTHINIHTHSHCAVPQKGADTRCARQGHTHLRTPGNPPSPAHPPRPALGQEQGLLRARAPPPDSFQQMFPYLACLVPGERASEMRQEPLGGRKLELLVLCLALSANSLTKKLFVAKAGWPASPLSPPPVLPPRVATGGPPAAWALRRCPSHSLRADRLGLQLI